MKHTIELLHGPDPGFGAAWVARIVMPAGNQTIAGRGHTLPDALRDLAGWLDARGQGHLTDEFYPDKL